MSLCFFYSSSIGSISATQVSDEQLFWQFNEESNSIATIVKHLWGNMLSRWTDFLSSDGEKEWRNRDAEFEKEITTRQDVWINGMPDGIVYLARWIH